ncbi:MAG: bifunctional glycosyltransferase family 2/GtrA family protein [Treponema sp.]|nr:bifunctional glycosyltransferase family 2/GtrA family protein [Treponema sp.]
MPVRRSVLLIPAYNPDGRLLQLAEEINMAGSQAVPPLVVVDDGSAPDCRWVFYALKIHTGCEVVRHETNHGKGAALKTGMVYILEKYPEATGIVTADADLQHLPQDILRVTQTLEENPNSMVLGSRNFSGKDVPFKSKWGNHVTSLIVYMITGIPALDTQTGLRGIPAAFAAECLGIRGNHFEFEMEALFHMARHGVPLITLPITTVYREQNRATSFRAVKDSILIYRSVLKFGAASAVCAGLDLLLFALFSTFIFGKSAGGIMAATIAARVCSGCCNFICNKFFVFGIRGKTLSAWIKYAALFAAIMCASGVLTGLLASTGIPAVAAKLLTDSLLFAVSYMAQKRFIFTRTA